MRSLRIRKAPTRPSPLEQEACNVGGGVQSKSSDHCQEDARAAAQKAEQLLEAFAHFCPF